VVVLEIRLGKIARQVRFRNMVELAIQGTLEKREERLGAVLREQVSMHFDANATVESDRRSYDAHLLTGQLDLANCPRRAIRISLAVAIQFISL
jgi:hypothetical protein